MENKLIVLVGPTASGKTEAALELAKKYPLEIISADSRQVYRFMDIGTGKPVEKKGHCLIDIVDPDEHFTVADYKAMAEKAIRAARRKRNVPFLVGGSGLYVRAVVDGLCPAPKANREVREKLESEAGRFGNQRLYNRLKKIDRASAQIIHPNDLRRIIRALEVYVLTGRPISHFRGQTKKSPYALLVLGIRCPRQVLYKRINARCEEMLKRGLVDEVRRLLDTGYSEHLKSMDGLGYKEVIGFLKGRHSVAEMTRLMKRNTRRYAKRQQTWFRKDKRINWIDVKGDGISYIISESSKYIDKFLDICYNDEFRQ